MASTAYIRPPPALQFAVPTPVSLPSQAASIANMTVPIVTVTMPTGMRMTPKNLSHLQSQMQTYLNQILMVQQRNASTWQYVTSTPCTTSWATIPNQITGTGSAMNAFAQQVYSSYYGQVPDDYPRDRKLPDDWAGRIELPDGTIIIGRGTDGITIEDKDAHVVYRAATRDFNRFLNASDIVEDFMRFAGKLGARRGEVLDLPLKLFIGLLLLEAAQADGEPPPADIVVALPPRQPAKRCVGCGRFMLAAAPVAACNGAHLDRYLMRTAHACL